MTTIRKRWRGNTLFTTIFQWVLRLRGTCWGRYYEWDRIIVLTVVNYFMEPARQSQWRARRFMRQWNRQFG